jgi:D-alanyl-D-alanine carboxypeptidase/D-alanyl-D-alanine-endopeptidase (penicillin-binding protein 4)
MINSQAFKAFNKLMTAGTTFSLAVITLSLSSCTPSIQRNLKKSILETELKFNDHTGFALYDLAKDKIIYQHKADRYFTPASNTKVFTLYTCFTILGDSLPSVKYLDTGDSLIFWGAGDPTLYNSRVYGTNEVLNFLKTSTKPLYFSSANFHTTRFGLGWAWDDYNGNYQPERSALPMYGNVLTGNLKGKELTITPSRFTTNVAIGAIQQGADLYRDEHTNHFVFHPSPTMIDGVLEVPFRPSDSLITQLLQDTLHRAITIISRPIDSMAGTIYSVPADSVYKVMMQDSDNLIAEQLLLQCSLILSDSLRPEIAIQFMQRNQLADLPDKVQWVDGSGLSRYNLFTPRSIIMVWKKLYEKVPRQRLLPLLAAGGENGTIRNWYKSDRPYIFGKTGTLANNHCLSGYLITKSGKTLIFSFMNSNYLATTSEIRKNMQRILEYIRNEYK